MNNTLYIYKKKEPKKGFVTVQRGFIYQPRTNFCGKPMKWYEDKVKES